METHTHTHKHTHTHIYKYIYIYIYILYILIYTNNIHTEHTKHDKIEHKWKHTCMYTYIKPLRPDPTKQSNTPNQILVHVDNTMGSGL